MESFAAFCVILVALCGNGALAKEPSQCCQPARFQFGVQYVAKAPDGPVYTGLIVNVVDHIAGKAKVTSSSNRLPSGEHAGFSYTAFLNVNTGVGYYLNSDGCSRFQIDFMPIELQQCLPENGTQYIGNYSNGLDLWRITQNQYGIVIITYLFTTPDTCTPVFGTNIYIGPDGTSLGEINFLTVDFTVGTSRAVSIDPPVACTIIKKKRDGFQHFFNPFLQATREIE